MSEDPKLFDAGDYNLFRYCHNDPVDLTDPMGTEPPYSPPGTIDVRPDVLAAGVASASSALKLSGTAPVDSKGIHFEFRVDGFRKDASAPLAKTTPVMGRETRTSQTTGQTTGMSKEARDLLSQGYKHEFIAHDHPLGGLPGHDIKDKRAANDVIAQDTKERPAQPVPSFLANGADGGARIEIYIPSSNREQQMHLEGGATLYSTDGGKTMTDGKVTYPSVEYPPRQGR